MRVAIVTGASSGIGKEFVKQLDRKKHVFEEFWLIARREDLMQELADSLHTKTRILAADLADPDGIRILEQELGKEKPTVSIVINAAGFGKLGSFEEIDLVSQSGMVDVNCRALTQVCHVCIPYMKHGGRILNVGSMAAFAPQPQFAVYAATKAYVLSFSRALARELKPKGIMVSCLCPGPVRTQFFTVAETYGSTLAFKKWFYARPEKVVNDAIRKMCRSQEVIVYSFPMQVARVLEKIIPHGLFLYIYQFGQKKQEKE